MYHQQRHMGRHLYTDHTGWHSPGRTFRCMLGQSARVLFSRLTKPILILYNSVKTYRKTTSCTRKEFTNPMLNIQSGSYFVYKNHQPICTLLVYTLTTRLQLPTWLTRFRTRA